ncbi:MAG: tRNA lysidine(34) synthetase TilS [Bacilli bacterium]|nr:tRNA lysidine(34) synthetase TilS [Bacilli bacterium]
MNIDKFIKSIDIENDDYIVIGVSAGPDSMALLHMLEKNLKCNLVCAHINHNIRIESDEEEKYLKEYCKEKNIIFESMKINSYTGKNFENEAREKRYAFYEHILKKYNSHNLFLAHHGDDLIETVLMKIVRGSNLEGYAGIKTYSYLDDYKIIRPLLSLTKDDIIKYNKDNNIKYYTDSTNKDTLYTRNRYRLNLLPLLKKEDKFVHLKFLKYSNTLQEYDNYINYEIELKINNIYKDNCINIDTLNKEHPFMKKNIIFYILSIIYNNKSNIIKEKNILDILKMTTSNRPNYKINLPKEYIANKVYNHIYIEKKKNKNNNSYKKELQNINIIDDIVIKLVDNIDTDGNNVCRLNSKNITLPLYLRNKLDGDYIEVKGLNGKKKIKDIFIDSKIPLDIRDKYPLLVDANNNILWIPFIKKSKYNVKNNEFCDIILTSHKEGDKENENKEKKY